MSHILDETTTKLHTDAAGIIWYSRGIAPPQNSEQTLAEFLLSPVVSGMGLQFRLFGTIENAELISALYLRKNRGEVRCVEVAAPHFLTAVERITPATALLKMRNISAPAAVGGWHAISFSDYSTYALAARMYRNRFVFDDMANNYLKMHPAYKALSFIPNFSQAAAAQLFVTITDPRWFVDTRAPENNLKIALYLGLTPAIQKRVSDPDTMITARRELRCANVLGCWKTVDTSSANLTDPANFLYRIWRFNGGGPRGDLRASQAFLTYIQQNWLSAIEQHRGLKNELFAPDLFFRAPAEIAAYTEHMQPKT
jgi:hypothetical protein